jgi:hypothetical protein
MSRNGYWQNLSRQVVVKTPDPFVNAAVPALCVAATACGHAIQGVSCTAPSRGATSCLAGAAVTRRRPRLARPHGATT